MGSEADLTIEAFGYDEFSGARKLFLSKPYTIHDIREGGLVKGGLGIEQRPARAGEYEIGSRSDASVAPQRVQDETGPGVGE